MLRFHMKAEAILSKMCHRTIKSILTFSGVNRPRKVKKITKPLQKNFA